MEIRVTDDGVEITGYVNAVGRRSDPLRDADGGYFTETIQPGAFGRSLEKNPNVPMLLNHQEGRVLASGSEIDLREDPVGLHVRANITDPEVVEKARSNQLRGWSFGFCPTRQKVDDDGSMRHRDVYDMDLLEVSLLDNTRRPAYPATSVYTRDGDTSVECRQFDDWWIDVNVDVVVTPPPDLSEYIEVIEELGTLE